MIEQKMRSALLLLAGSLLAAGAWGQTVKFVQNNQGMVQVASEYFGSADGREVTFDGDKQPMITLQIMDDDTVTGAGVLDVRNEATLTFTLNGATFASSVNAGDLKLYDNPAGNEIGDTTADVESNAMQKSVASGGTRGDRSVTFDLEVTGTTAINPATGGPKFLAFEMPSLQVTPARFSATDPAAGSGVTVVAGLVAGRSGASPFPSRVEGSVAANAAGRQAINPVADGAVITLASALTASVGTGGTAQVALADRKAIIGTSGVSVTMADGAKARGLNVGQVSVTLDDGTGGEIYVLRGDDFAVNTGTLDSTLAGTLNVSVRGPFQTGDRVLLGANQRATGAKPFEMSGGAATVELALRENITAMDMVYVPGGVDDLKPANFVATASWDFNDSDNASGSATRAPAVGRLSYQGISSVAYAYGISRANDEATTSFLRVTCASAAPPATGCRIFMDCTGEDGASYFGDLTGTGNVPTGATGVFTSGQIATALGGGWDSGGGRCDLQSNGSLQVQHMVRTSGNALHNNSVVLGRTHTITTSTGLLGGPGIHPANAVTVSLPTGQLFRLPSGEFYGTYMAINALAASLGSESDALTADCGTIAADATVTATTPCATPMGAVPLMSGDIIYPATATLSSGVYRPASQGYIATPMASSTAPVLSP